MNNENSHNIILLVNRMDGCEWKIDEVKPDHVVKVSRPRSFIERVLEQRPGDRWAHMTPLEFQLTFCISIYDVIGAWL